MHPHALAGTSPRHNTSTRCSIRLELPRTSDLSSLWLTRSSRSRPPHPPLAPLSRPPPITLVHTCAHMCPLDTCPCFDGSLASLCATVVWRCLFEAGKNECATATTTLHSIRRLAIVGRLMLALDCVGTLLFLIQIDALCPATAAMSSDGTAVEIGLVLALCRRLDALRHQSHGSAPPAHSSANGAGGAGSRQSLEDPGPRWSVGAESGVPSRCSRTFVLATTSRLHGVHPSVLRMDRLGLTVSMPVPTLPSREVILAGLIPGGINDPARMELVNHIALDTPGFCAADLRSVCQDAAVRAVRAHDRTNPTVTSDAPPTTGAAGDSDGAEGVVAAGKADDGYGRVRPARQHYEDALLAASPAHLADLSQRLLRPLRFDDLAGLDAVIRELKVGGSFLRALCLRARQVCCTATWWTTQCTHARLSSDDRCGASVGVRGMAGSGRAVFHPIGGMRYARYRTSAGSATVRAIRGGEDDARIGVGGVVPRQRSSRSGIEHSGESSG
jgi:hypothetical protein